MERLLIIKLGAKGDVVRTIPIAQALKKIKPLCKITWVTGKSSVSTIELSSSVDEVKEPGDEIKGNYDVLYNFDIDEEATTLAQKIQAKKKLGFFSESGFPISFNMESEYYLNTLFDDKLKKKNKKTYQEMMFEVAELKFNGENAKLNLDEKSRKYSEEYLAKNNLTMNDKIVGIHMGASPRWPSKAWNLDELKKLITMTHSEGYKIILFGGPNERELHSKLSIDLENKNIKIYRNNPENSDREFASLVNLCSAVVCADSFALHIALALEKPTIGLFFCTSPLEVEGYGLLKKIVSPKLYEFFPEKMDQYDEGLTKSISAEKVFSTLKGIFNNNKN